MVLHSHPEHLVENDVEEDTWWYEHATCKSSLQATLLFVDPISMTTEEYTSTQRGIQETMLPAAASARRLWKELMF